MHKIAEILLEQSVLKVYRAPGKGGLAYFKQRKSGNK